MKRQIIAWILTATLLMVPCTFASAEETQQKSIGAFFLNQLLPEQKIRGAEDPSVAEMLSFLQAVGVIVDLNDGVFEADSFVSRAEVAVMVTGMMGETPFQGETETGFSDVFSSHWAAGYIAKAYNLGLMLGDEESGLFRPEDFISGDEALKIVLHALGYDLYAEANGGYPDGYRLTANRLKLTEFSIAYEEPCTRLQLLNIIYKALQTPVLTRTAWGDTSNFYTNEDETLMQQRMHIYHDKGQITETEISALGGESSLLQGYVRIGETTYNTGNTKAKHLLGFTVDFYYQENELSGAKTLIYVKPDMKNSLIIDSEEIIGYSDYTYQYNKNARLLEKKLNTNTSFIYNGKAYDDYTAMVPEYGFVVVLPGEESMVVLIYELGECVVANVNMDDGSIYGQIGTDTIVSVDDGELNLYSEDGELTAPEAIPKNAVITFYQSIDNSYCCS